MYIYAIYDNFDLLEKAKLKQDSIICVDHKLYKVIDADKRVITKMQLFKYLNSEHKRKVEEMCKLKYDGGDIIQILE